MKVGVELMSNFNQIVFIFCLANGIAFGDPIDGRLTILTTVDGGISWQEAPESSRPEVLPGEYAFAASGTCLRTQVNPNNHNKLEI